jgi:hypothetical protein
MPPVSRNLFAAATPWAPGLKTGIRKGIRGDNAAEDCKSTVPMNNPIKMIFFNYSPPFDLVFLPG